MKLKWKDDLILTYQLDSVFITTWGLENENKYWRESLALESGINKFAGTIWVVGLQAYCVHTQQIFVKL